MASRNYRFFSITTADKRSAVENAWEDSQKENNGNLRQTLRCKLRDSQHESENGQVIQSSSSNNHSGSYSAPGEGAAAPAEYAKMWQDLIDLYDDSLKFISFCDKYALDAFCTLLENWPVSPPFPPIANPAIIIDTTGEWLRLVNQFGIDQVKNQIIGAVVSPAAVFLFMMYRLVPVTESRADYGNLRLTGGFQYA